MCLKINDTLTAKRKKQTTGFRYLYKLVTKSIVYNGDNWLKTPYQNTKIKPGWFLADKVHIRSGGDGKFVDNSIHVFNSLAEAEDRKVMSFDRIMKVKCYNKDFVACNNTDSAYKKIFIPKSEYDKCLRK